jgi:undecaprenyl-diphosphatase
MPFDVQLLRYLNGFAGKSRFLDVGIIFCATYLPFALGALFFVYLYVVPTTSERMTVFLTATLSSFGARFIVAEAIRLLYKRPRPFVTHQLHPLVSQNQWSFPSGHAVFFFALAQAVYFFSPLWGVSFFALSVVVAISRVAAGVHYPSDVLAGALTGVLVAHAILTAIAFYT